MAKDIKDMSLKDIDSMRLLDTPLNTQNSGVTLLATIDNFSNARDHNLPMERLSIIKLINISLIFFRNNVLFTFDWIYSKVDEYGLNFVYFKKQCSIDDHL